MNRASVFLVMFIIWMLVIWVCSVGKNPSGCTVITLYIFSLCYTSITNLLEKTTCKSRDYRLRSNRFQGHALYQVACTFSPAT